MILPAKAYVAVVDGQQFLLMRNEGTATEPDLQGVGKPDVAETNFSAGVRQQDIKDIRPREALYECAHAAGVAEWLNHAILNHTIKKVVVIADPKTLGEMRKHYHKETEAALLGELRKDMTNVPSREILKAIEAS